MDTKSAVRAQGQTEFEEFWTTWIVEMEKVQVALAHLTKRVNLQDAELQNLEVDVGTLHGEIQMLSQVDDVDRKAATQQVTHL